MTSGSKTSNGKSQCQVSTFIYNFHSHKNAPNQNSNALVTSFGHPLDIPFDGNWIYVNWMSVG